MKKHLRSLFLYLTAIFLSAAIILLILPVVAQNMLAAHVPAMDDSFKRGFFYHTVLMAEAATIAALFGFFMNGNKSLRRATLTLPLWAPLIYAVLYLALAYR